MELQFQNNTLRCLRQSAGDTRTAEQTLEVRLPDNMPEVGKVLGAWGQPLIRGKDWRGDHVAVNGGVMARVLYDAEDGSGVNCVEGWIPFQLRWELRDSQRDGSVTANCMLRSMDARLVGAGKLMIRAVLSAWAEALEPEEYTLSAAAELPEDVQILEESYPVRLAVEAGEKAMILEEDLVLPPGNVDIERILFYRLVPTVSEKKLMADKLVFRGAAQLHVIYLGTDGVLHACDVDVPMSQYTQLEREYGPEAELRVEPAVTDLELEWLDDGRMRLKAGLVGQYVICDRPVIRVVRDAYSTRRPVQLHTQQLSLPMILEERTEQMTVSQSVPAQVDQMVDRTAFAAHPRMRQAAQETTMEMEGATQLLFYDTERRLQCVLTPWEQQVTLPAAENARIMAGVEAPASPEVTAGAENADVRTDLALWMRTMDMEGIPMVTGLTLGEMEELNPERPSLILRRAGELSLWETAKKCGSTVAAIRHANGLTEEPEQGQMLLIPVE